MAADSLEMKTLNSGTKETDNEETAFIDMNGIQKQVEKIIIIYSLTYCDSNFFFFMLKRLTIVGKESGVCWILGASFISVGTLGLVVLLILFSPRVPLTPFRLNTPQQRFPIDKLLKAPEPKLETDVDPRVPLTPFRLNTAQQRFPIDKLLKAPEPKLEKDVKEEEEEEENLFLSLLFPIINSSHFQAGSVTLWNIDTEYVPLLSMALQWRKNASWEDILWLKGDIIFEFQEYLLTCPNMFCSPRILTPDTVSCSGATPLSFIFNCSNDHLEQVIIRGVGRFPDLELPSFISHQIHIFIQFLFS